MTDPHRKPTERRRGEERRLYLVALLVSLVVHVLVFVLWPVMSVFLSPFAAAGPRAGDDRAATGSMQALNLGAPPTQPLVPPPVPLPLDVAIEPIEFDDEVLVEAGSFVGEMPGLEGPGLEDGLGRGDAGTSDSGLFRLVPPTPRGMIIPPSNDGLRGREVEVWVFVDAQGRVVADSTQLRPPTSDGEFNSRLVREAAEWVFDPARKGGEPVPSWFPYRISM